MLITLYYFIVTKMDKIIERKLHAFIFKWIRNITYPIKDSGEHITTWNNMNGRYHTRIDNFVKRCINEQSDGKHGREKTQINSCNIPCLEICERMCYTNDYIIKVTQCRNSKTSIECVIISACGTVITYANNEMNMIRFGTEKYPDAIIDMIKNMENIDTLSVWDKIFSEVDDIQNNINIYKNLFEHKTDA